MPDVDVVLDTDVLIGIFRGDSLAKTWLVSIESRVIGIPVFVRMEILLGARNKQDSRLCLKTSLGILSSTLNLAIRKEHSAGSRSSV